MSTYQDHILFGSVLVLVFSYFIGPYLSYSLDAVIVSAALILLASIFPDIDHRGSVVHKRLRAFTVLLVAAVPVMLAYPNATVMVAGGVMAAAGTYYVFESIKPKHRGVTHTFTFCALFSLATGTVTLYAFGSFLPAIFTFVAYLSHLVLDGTFQ